MINFKQALSAIFMGACMTMSAQQHSSGLSEHGQTDVAWMEHLSPTAYLDQISIPGAHDAATGNGTKLDSFARTQQLSLTEQFVAGVRAFDLRPSVDNDILKIYHGIVETNVTFEDALDELFDCLKAYPTEWIVVVIRHEDDHENDDEKGCWNDMISRLLRSEKYTGRIVDFNPGLTVEDVRGKMLLLSRDKYSSRPIGGFISGWNHSPDFSEQGNGNIKGESRGYSRLYVQDFYEVGSSEKDLKLQSIKNLLDYSTTLNQDNGHTWVINHTSGYIKEGLFSTADSYRKNAANTNAFVIDFLADTDNAGPIGMVMMDFAGVDQAGSYDVKGRQLVNAVIENNNHYIPRGKQSSGIEAIGNRGPDKDRISVVANGDIRADGEVSVYTMTGELYAAGYGRVAVTVPGIYIARTACSAVKIIVR